VRDRASRYTNIRKSGTFEGTFVLSYFRTFVLSYFRKYFTRSMIRKYSIVSYESTFVLSYESTTYFRTFESTFESTFVLSYESTFVRYLFPEVIRRFMYKLSGFLHVYVSPRVHALVQRYVCKKYPLVYTYTYCTCTCTCRATLVLRLRQRYRCNTGATSSEVYTYVYSWQSGAVEYHTSGSTSVLSYESTKVRKYVTTCTLYTYGSQLATE
jgi:hypothetical protein